MNSPAFREKRKLPQNELRKMMKEEKESRTQKNANKIDSPFAKYDNGQLTCVLCKSIVRSENVWKVHINAKQHKENLALAKQLKEKIENQSKKPEPGDRVAGLKRSIEEMRSEVPEKKLKGILKNSTTLIESTTTVLVAKNKQSETTNDDNKNDQAQQKKSSVPDDFFDAKSKSSGNSTKTKSAEPIENEKMQVDEALPEGFFDDPVKDAKARHLEYKDPVEEEWDKFQKEIKEAEVKSSNLINEEHEEATVERQIDEIDEQIRNWSR